MLNKLFPFQLCRWASLVLGRSSSHLKRKTIMLMDTLWCGCIPMHWFMSRRIMKSKWKICRVTSSSYNAKIYSLFLHRTKIECIHQIACFIKQLSTKLNFNIIVFYCILWISNVKFTVIVWYMIENVFNIKCWTLRCASFSNNLFLYKTLKIMTSLVAWKKFAYLYP